MDKKKCYDAPDLELFRLKLEDVLSISKINPYDPEIGAGGGDEGDDRLDF